MKPVRSSREPRVAELSELAGIRRRADADTSDVKVQITAAYACDGAGLETEAVTYYDRAWHLGVPDEDRHDFVVGYGSTLRNVGRLDESLEILEMTADEFEDDLAPPAFLALTLNSSGRSDEAVALLLDASSPVTAPGVERYRSALRSYTDLLRGGT